MIIRKITDTDYPEILSWFASRKWPQPPVEDIAPQVGFVAEENGQLVACAWSYFTGRSIAFIEWTGTNPALTDELGTKGLHYVLDAIKDFCAVSNPPVRALCLFTQNDKLCSHFSKMGFKSAKGYTRLMWVAK